MQIMIDTATDSPEQLYRISTFLRSLSETPAAARPEVLIVGVPSLTPPAPPAPPAPLAMADVVNDDDMEVEIDDAGNVTAVTVSTELPPAPPPPAPVAPLPPQTPAPPGPAVAAELDARHMPWDARIHATNRAKTIQHVWKYKRGIDKNLIAACEAQNKLGNATPAVSTTAAPAPLTVPAAVSPATSAAAPPAPTAPPPLSPTAGTVAPVAAVPSNAIDFRGLMQKIQAATAAGKLTADQVNAALAGCGLKPEEMAQLINNAPLIASVNAAIDRCI